MPRTLQDAPTRFYVTDKLSGSLSLTKEGFLLAEGVHLAKIGPMTYGPEEVGVDPGPRGYVTVDTEAAELFRPETVASCNGKPVLNEHPENKEKGVDPENWKQLAGGTLLNPRRDGDYLDGDLLVADAGLIEEVLGLRTGQYMEFIERGDEGRKELADLVKDRQGKNSKREVSLGYEADYEEIEPGRGRKIGIIVNHVALVVEGRCGQTCQIHDHQPRGARKMAKRNSIIDRLRSAWKTQDKKTFDEAMSEAEPLIGDDDEPTPAGEHHVHVHLPATAEPEKPAVVGDAVKKYSDEELDKRFKEIGDSLEEIKGRLPATEPKPAAGEGDEDVVEDADGYLTPKNGDGKMKTKDGDKEIEGELEEEAPEGTGDKARKAHDSQYLGESFRDTVAACEILAPGMKTPTYDRKYHPRLTYDNICRMRRNAITKALKDPQTAPLISQARGRTTDAATVARLTCNSIRMMFVNAVNLKKTQNNDGYRRPVFADAGRQDDPKPVTSISDLNKRNQAFYSGK